MQGTLASSEFLTMVPVSATSSEMDSEAGSQRLHSTYMVGGGTTRSGPMGMGMMGGAPLGSMGATGGTAGSSMYMGMQGAAADMQARLNAAAGGGAGGGGGGAGMVGSLQQQYTTSSSSGTSEEDQPGAKPPQAGSRGAYGSGGSGGSGSGQELTSSRGMGQGGRGNGGSGSGSGSGQQPLGQQQRMATGNLTGTMTSDISDTAVSPLVSGALHSPSSTSTTTTTTTTTSVTTSSSQVSDGVF